MLDRFCGARFSDVIKNVPGHQLPSPSRSNFALLVPVLARGLWVSRIPLKRKSGQADKMKAQSHGTTKGGGEGGNRTAFPSASLKRRRYKNRRYSFHSSSLSATFQNLNYWDALSWNYFPNLVTFCSSNVHIYCFQERGLYFSCMMIMVLQLVVCVPWSPLDHTRVCWHGLTLIRCCSSIWNVRDTTIFW